MDYPEKGFRSQNVGLTYKELKIRSEIRSLEPSQASRVNTQQKTEVHQHLSSERLKKISPSRKELEKSPSF